jgi:hypothetical protein
VPGRWRGASGSDPGYCSAVNENERSLSICLATAPVNRASRVCGNRLWELQIGGAGAASTAGAELRRPIVGRVHPYRRQQSSRRRNIARRSRPTCECFTVERERAAWPLALRRFTFDEIFVMRFCRSNIQSAFMRQGPTIIPISSQCVPAGTCAVAYGGWI